MKFAWIEDKSAQKNICIHLIVDHNSMKVSQLSCQKSLTDTMNQKPQIEKHSRLAEPLNETIKIKFWHRKI